MRRGGRAQPQGRAGPGCAGLGGVGRPRRSAASPSLLPCPPPAPQPCRPRPHKGRGCGRRGGQPARLRPARHGAAPARGRGLEGGIGAGGGELPEGIGPGGEGPPGLAAETQIPGGRKGPEGRRESGGEN